ncbi:9403_t:CDS:2, partial [Cetraspora pellucida]
NNDPFLDFEVISGLTSLQISGSWLNASNQLAIDVVNYRPPFTHIQQPYKSYYIGSNTPLDDPDYYLDFLRELIIVYRHNIACGPDFGMHVDEEIRLKLHWLKQLILLKFQLNIHCRSSYFSLSYFCSTTAMLTKQENTKWWQSDKPLIHHFQWCLDWTKGLTKGVFVFSGDVPWSQLLCVLNDSIVGLVGITENKSHCKRVLDLPTCFMLDHSNNISTGVCGVPLKELEDE